MLAVLTKVAVVDPVGVLSHKLVDQTVPVLSVDVALCVPVLIDLHVVVVVATWEEICCYQWVGINTLVHHVTVVLVDIIGTHIEGQLVAKHL